MEQSCLFLRVLALLPGSLVGAGGFGETSQRDSSQMINGRATSRESKLA